ncbi:MAG: hypothetical protein E2604_09090 [Flavobacterium sp.]|nr:hypothetical protein [Flavobacterium sp.]
MDAKKRFEVSFVIGIVFMLLTIFSLMLMYAARNEDQLLQWFGVNELFISSSDITEDDFIVNGYNISNFYDEGIKEEFPIGQWVILDGEVLQCDLAMGNRPYIGLGIGKYHAFGCFFDVEFTDYLLHKIKPKTKIRIRGQFKGEMYGSLVFSDCSIVK